MKKLMILGGGVNQLPLIKASKREGYFTVVCDYNEAPPAAGLCDRIYQVSANDREAVLEIARQEQIDGIAANTEALMETLAWLTEQLGLTGNREQAVNKLTCKNQFRRLQHSIGAFAPESYEVSEMDQIWPLLDRLKFPVIIKPCESSGSRGVQVIGSAEETQQITESFLNCREYSRNRKVVVEEFIEMASMDEVEAEIFVHEGEILWPGLLLTLRNTGSALIPTTDIYPLPYEEDKISQIHRELEKTIRAAGITHGEYNAEMHFTADGELFILEINPRQGGDSIPFYVRESSGVDLTRLLVTTAVGDNSYWDSLRSYHGKTRYITHHPLYPEKSGVFDGLWIDQKVHPYLIKTETEVQKGGPIAAAEDATGGIGYVDFEFPDQQTQLLFSMEMTKYVQILVN